MRKGCCCGCFLVGAVFIALLVALAFFGLDQVGVFESNPPVDTVAHIAGRPAVLARVDPNDPELLGILAAAFEDMPIGFMAWPLPHELSLALELDEDRDHVLPIMTVNMKRLSGLMPLWFGKDSFAVYAPALEVLSAKSEAPGLWVVRGAVPVAKDFRDLAEAWWDTGGWEALSLEGGHVAELLVDNRDGGAMLALEPFLTKPKVGTEAIEVIPNPFGLEPVRLPGLFRRIDTARCSIDIPEPDRIAVRITVTCPREADVESVLMPLMAMRDALYAMLIEEGVVLEGHFEIAGTQLVGDFAITEVREKIEEMAQRAMEQ